MHARTKKLYETSLNAQPVISPERALLLTQFYKDNEGKFSAPEMRANAFYHLCAKKTLFLGEDELIVGERGPAPKATPTYPELTCHSLDDLTILNDRPKVHYGVDKTCFDSYKKTIIPYWRGRSMRDLIFQEMSTEWLDAYEAGIFTEFMEQRAPGHTVLDDKIYHKGMLDFKKEIHHAMAKLDYHLDPDAFARRAQLKAMAIACDAVILFARRHAQLARQLAKNESEARRKKELLKIAAVCTRVPAHAPRDFHEALQYYWFCHLAVITELNGWDAFNPGHLDQHLLPFYEKGIASGILDTGHARALLEAFFIKFNNHPAPPKVGVTAAESGTYTDFANINIGGVLSDGSDGSNVISHMLLDIIEDMHLLQPSSNIQLSRKSPDFFLKHALRVIRKGYGFPSIFNSDAVVQEQLRQGKTLEDARAGGCSGCVETGAFGKEAYILTGYFNLVKILELTLHNGTDPRTGKKIGTESGAVSSLKTFDHLYHAFTRQLKHFLDIKVTGNQIIEQMYARRMPAPFLSVLIDDCIEKGKDYNAGGARYNNNFIQLVGIGSLTDCFAALNKIVYEEHTLTFNKLLTALEKDFDGYEPLRQQLIHKMPKYGNDDDTADTMMVRLFQTCFNEIDGRPNSKGGHYRVEMLPTTCHIYFGSVTGAMPDGRKAGKPLSEGISPVQGADRNGPTAVIQSAAKMDHLKTGGTLLNIKFTPALVDDDAGLEKWAHLVRSYFKMDGHHLQFNIIDAETLRKAQHQPDAYRNLIVRVAGYSDYFCDLTQELQDEIITRTEHRAL
jgi:pyruvate formate-lyase/glycerol dehydratase family glycyl radical enzyme